MQLYTQRYTKTTKEQSCQVQQQELQPNAMTVTTSSQQKYKDTIAQLELKVERLERVKSMQAEEMGSVKRQLVERELEGQAKSRELGELGRQVHQMQMVQRANFAG